MNRGDQVKWQIMPMLSYDVESTGKSAHDDRIVTACIVEFQPQKRPVATNWIIDPGIEIPDQAAEIHGWTTERIKAHPGVRTPEEALFEISGRLALWMGRRFPLVAMNAAYDLTMTEAENRRHGLPTLEERVAPKPIGPVLDPMVLDKRVDPYRPAKCDGKQKRPPRCTCGAEDKRLTSLCRHYGVPLVAAHTAESDAASAVRLARAIIAAHPDAFRGMTIGGLHQAQKQWRAEQQKSLAAYFDKNGTAHDGCDGGWPIMATPAPVAPVDETTGALL